MHDRKIDWTKIREVGLALLWFGHSDCRKVPCRTPQWLLDGLYEDGFIDDPRAGLGNVQLTKEGLIEAETMIRKHFHVPMDASTHEGLDGER